MEKQCLGCRAPKGASATRAACDVVVPDRDKVGWKLSAIAREVAIGKKIACFATTPLDAAKLESEIAVGIVVEDVLERRFPRDAIEQLNRSLFNIARIAPTLGWREELSWQTDWPLFFVPHQDAMDFVARSLSDLGWLSITGESSSGFGAAITPVGWQRVYELRKERTNEHERQGFIAMWFGSREADAPGGAISIESCDALFSKGLEPGIRDAGYDPLRIDKKDYLGKIDTEIVSEIRRSRFVVADFTGHRGGVYFEAGFAMALGVPVFLFCHQAHQKQLHFDLNHYNFVFWNNPEDVRQELSRRIPAAIGWGPAAKRV